MDNKICIRCAKFINEKESYLEIKEYDKEKVVRTNFIHKICWDMLIDSKNKVNEAFGMLKGIIKRHKLLPEEEYIVK